jgi:signal transduction histidine kinase
MSYQSIKRVLGETSLERKCRFLFGACLLLLITTSFLWYGWQTEKLVDQQNRNTGSLLVDQVMLIKHWGELETNEGFRPVVQNLTERLSKRKYEWRFIQPTAADNTPGAPADEFEWKALDDFLRGPPPAEDSEVVEFRERNAPRGGQYEYYQPIRAEESCLLVCHRPPPGGTGLDITGAGVALGGKGLMGTTPLSEGDVMAVVKVSIPTKPTQRALNLNRAILLSTAIVTVLLAMIASYIIVRYVIVKPLRHLTDVSDAISRGNIALRADIHTGDEFEALAMSFNRMLRHMVTAQDELRQANTNLDSKVDELAQANMRLYEMNTLKSDFMATMSHELRTPLNSILGFSEVLGSIETLDEKQKRYVGNIQKSGRVLLDMINDVLDLAKIESGKMDMRLTDFAIESLISAQCDMARPLTEKKNIDLTCRLDAGMPPMYQDQARVQQVLNNLLSNAIKFTPEGGRIVIGARRDETDYLVLQVADTGVGIAEEDQQAIFEKFRQGRTAMPGGDPMTREYSGSGLGLSIVRELCRLLGGDVSLQSELGKGSTFTVRLPWRLEAQPRLDSALTEGFEEFTRGRFELLRDRKAMPPDPERKP